MDKKAAEEQARQAKEATGRALFEKGDWQDSENEEDSDEEEGEEEDDAWNLEKLRQETEALREKKEAERIGGAGTYVPPSNGAASAIEPDSEGDNDEAEPS
jgi:hypothetical protein